MVKRKSLTKKFILSFVLFGILNTIVLVGIGGFLYRRSIIEQYERMGYQLASSIASTVSEEEMNTISRIARDVYLGEADEEEVDYLLSNERFLRLDVGMDNTRDRFGAADFFVVGMIEDEVDDYIADPDGKRSPFYIIVDSFDDPTYDFSLGDPAPLAPRMMPYMKEALLTGEQPTAHLINKREEGYFIQSFLPVSCGEGEPRVAYSVVLRMETLLNQLRHFVFVSLLVSALLSALFIYIYVKLQMRTLIKPIRMVSDEAGHFVKNELSEADASREISLSEKLLTVNTYDELQTLGESIYAMEAGIRDYIENLTRVTAEKERIGAELSVATQIQADMLPGIFPAFPDRKEFDLYATMTPAREVGGDFYDFFLIDDDHLALVMADVSGKGVPAALFMVIAKTLIKNHAQMGEYSPAKVLMQVNDTLCQGNEAELFVTVWLAILQISTGKGLAANAGHEHPALRSAEGYYELIKYRHSPAVATMEGIRFREHEFELHPGDSLFVYTDGVPEATDGEDTLFGTERMMDALNRNPAARPEELLRNVKEDIDTFVGEAQQFDDITMLALEFHGADKEV